MWITSSDDNTVSKVDPVSGETLMTLTVGVRPTAIAARADSLWIGNSGESSISRVRFPGPGLSPTVRSIHVGRGPTGIAVGAGAVWVANSIDRTVSRIDPTEDQVVNTIRLGRVVPADISVAAGRVWVTAQSES